MWEVSKRNFCVRKSNGDGPEAAWGYRSVSWSLALGKFRFSCFVLLLAHVNAVFLFCFSTCCGPSAVSASVVSEPKPVHKNVNLRGYLMSTSDGAGGCWSLIAVVMKGVVWRWNHVRLWLLSLSDFRPRNADKPPSDIYNLTKPHSEICQFCCCCVCYYNQLIITWNSK